ncbi:MAG: hypothetical protein GC204_14940 [Chloroflexi bacterium]|nr:hypothetical protein [Chloroflexota bacterium]
MSDQIGLWIGFILTLMVFSYLLGDNFLYRLAIYVFVGLAAGFVTMATVESVLLPWLRATLQNGDMSGKLIGAIPLVLGLLLLLKSRPRFNRLGNLGLAFVVGIGTAIALVGAISGTLLPLANATASSVAADALNGFILVLGVVSTLVYFQYMARRVPGGTETRRGLVVRAVGAVGQGFIVVTLGALYGGAILSGLVVFSERIAFILTRIGGS